MEKGNFQQLKRSYVVCPWNQTTYVLFYQGQQILMDLSFKTKTESSIQESCLF